MLQPSPAPAAPFLDRFRSEAGRRTLALLLALAVELLLLLLLLTLGVESRPGEPSERPTLVRLEAAEAPEPAAEPAAAADPAPADERPPAEQPLPPQPAAPAPPAEPRPVPVAPPVLPAPAPAPPPPAAAVPREPAPPAPARRPVYGPPDTGRPPAMRDSERVGTAPNGEPLYAAEWYREPDKKMLGDYLSTARGPGWGLIACRTAPGYRVEDCVGISEYPQGSQIMHSVLAAAWEFRVRPARVGGRPLVGSWVRIRIDYSIEGR